MTSQVIENKKRTAINHLVITVGKQIFRVMLVNMETAKAFKTVLTLIFNRNDLIDLAQALEQCNGKSRLS
ncbi:hypothetical protein RV10_GL004065 [Enterococcus pallens]|nr:hypothetical protein RV10_GL004065 [Enterococcus pallens]